MSKSVGSIYSRDYSDYSEQRIGDKKIPEEEEEKKATPVPKAVKHTETTTNLDDRLKKGGTHPIQDEKAQTIAEKDIHPKREKFAQSKNQPFQTFTRSSLPVESETEKNAPQTTEISQTDLEMPEPMPVAALNDSDACENVILPRSAVIFERSKTLQQQTESLNSLFKETEDPSILKKENKDTINALDTQIHDSIKELKTMCKNITIKDDEDKVKPANLNELIKLQKTMRGKKTSSQYMALTNIKRSASNLLAGDTTIELLKNKHYLKLTKNKVHGENEYKTKINEQITSDNPINDTFIESLVDVKTHIIKEQKKLESIITKTHIDEQKKRFNIKSEMDADTLAGKSLLSTDEAIVKKDIKEDIEKNLDGIKRSTEMLYNDKLNDLIDSNTKISKIVDESIDLKKDIIDYNNKIQKLENLKEISTDEKNIKKLICRDVEAVLSGKIVALVSKRGKLEEEETDLEEELDVKIENFNKKIKLVMNFASKL